MIRTSFKKFLKLLEEMGEKRKITVCPETKRPIECREIEGIEIYDFDKVKQVIDEINREIGEEYIAMEELEHGDDYFIYILYFNDEGEIIIKAYH